MRLRKAAVVAPILRFASGKERKTKARTKKRKNNEWLKKCGGLEKLAMKQT
jgi:hypothetical protein